VLFTVATAVLLMPNGFGASERRALAVTAVRLSAAPLGVAILRPLAKAGDAIAQNDLGVLLHRGTAGSRDAVEAAQLLNAAAAAGLPRAQLNLVLLRDPCDSNARAHVIAALENFAHAGDRRAASLAADCFESFSPIGAVIEEARRVLAMAAIATATSDPDEELKFGWVLLTWLRKINSYGSEADALAPRIAQQAARYLFRAAEHGRPAGYEGISQLAGKAASLLAGDAVADRVAARSPAGWIEQAAEAGHPRSRCSFGVELATRLSTADSRASDADRTRVADMYQSCLNDRDPRQIVFKDGREQTLGHYRLFDVWMMDEAFLIASPRYDNHDYDIVARDDAIRRMALLARLL
jgi:TPR repeat protein